MTDSIAAPSRPAIHAVGVFKSFGDVTALRGVDMVVPAGTLTALLGPNGAGKTTLVRIIATLTRADRGRVSVLGFDVAAHPGEVRARIGLTGQFAGLDDALTGRDNLVLIGRLAGLRRRAARDRAAELTGLLGLEAAAGRPVRTYSGGMRRRLDLAASLMARPPLLVLDEPTTGLDPASRQRLWESLAGLRAAGTTMLLTTQYLEEADRFADLVHVLDRGAVIASGNPVRLKSLAGGQVVEITLAGETRDPGDTRATGEAGATGQAGAIGETGATGEAETAGLAGKGAARIAAGVLARRLGLAPGSVRAGPGAGRLTVLADSAEVGGAGLLVEVAAALHADGLAVADIGLRQPSLDEAFLSLTGRTGGRDHGERGC